MNNLLFLRDRTLPEWRKAAQTTHKKQYDRLLKHAASYADTVLPNEHPDDSITYIGMGAANLALAHLLTDDPAYLETLRYWLKTGISFPHWGKKRMPDHDLDTAWLLFGFSLAYSWVGDRLPDDERNALVAKLRLQGERLYDFAVETEGSWWSSGYWQNHNWICYGGLLTAAYALQSEEYDTSAWVSRAIENFEYVVTLFPEDGSDYEGVVYWRYGFQFLLFPLHLMAQESAIDLHEDCLFIRHAFEYRMALAGPNWVDTANFGDCHDRRSSHSRMMLYRFSSVYRNGEAQWLAEHFEEIGEWEREGREGMVKPGLLPEAWVDFAWYDPSVEPVPLQTLPVTNAFPDMGLLTARSSWQKDATYLAFKCGTPNGARGWQLGKALDQQNDWDIIRAGHEHPDENSFILLRGDDYLTVDPGYSRDKRTHNHSTILIDGQGQYNEGGYNSFTGLDRHWGGRLQSWLAADDITYGCGEAAGAYHPSLQLQQFRRQIMLLGDDVVLICDDLAAGVPRDYQWLLQTDEAAEKSAENQFTITTPNTTMSVNVLTPFTHTQRAIEISANPTSAKPDWIITQHQHTLALSAGEPRERMRFVVALGLGDSANSLPTLTAHECTGGAAIAINRGDQQQVAAFSMGQGRLVVGELVSADSAWLVATPQTGQFTAGDVTQLWLNNTLSFMASAPVDVTYESEKCTIIAKQRTWISLKYSEQMQTIRCNGKLLTTSRNEKLPLFRFSIEAGESLISWSK